MAKRYSRFHSNYILKKKHQETLKGTIWERDWVTIGAQHQLEKGKRVFYGDTNFLFTDNSFTSYKKRHKFSKWIGEWNYADAVNAASEDLNIVRPNWESTDLRDFAYYGSCVKLVENAVINIVKWFPGRMVIGDENLYVGEKYGENIEVTEEGAVIVPYTSGNILQNPFGLDLYRNIYDQVTDENKKRYVADYYYEFEVNGEEIIDYNIVKLPTDCIGREIVKICKISILTATNTQYFIDGYDIFGDVVYVEAKAPYKLYYTDVDETTDAYKPIYPSSFDSYTDPVYIHNDDINKVYVFVRKATDETMDETLTNIILYDNNAENKYTPYCYEMLNDGVGTGLFCSIEKYESLNDDEKSNYALRYFWAISPEEYVKYVNSDDYELNEEEYFTLNILNYGLQNIKPFFGELGKIQTLQETPINIRLYLDSLYGFEHLLLNYKTNPLYRVTLKTPIETDNGFVYSEKFYTWPSVDGYIDVNSVTYDQYISSLLDIATIFDDTWCDNLWRSMTHEAIRNFDWSYTKDYVEGDEEAFINGGERMQDVMHIYGTIVDELKRYIDGIKMTNNVSYDGFNNMSSAEMTDKLSYRGWDVFSIIPLFNDGDANSDEETIADRNLLRDNISTVRVDEGFVKTYLEKQQEYITEADYYKLSSETQSRYTFNYIRVSTDPSVGNLYDAVGTDVIMADEYEDLIDKSGYTPRYQDTIIEVKAYDNLSNNDKEKYAVYEYIKRNDSGDGGHILLFTEYDGNRWQEDYMWDGYGYCLMDKRSGECVIPLQRISENDYNNMRGGKNLYVPYTYYKKNEVVNGNCWKNINTGQVITNTQYQIDSPSITIYNDEVVYVRNNSIDIYCNETSLDIMDCGDNVYYAWTNGDVGDPYLAIYTTTQTPSDESIIYAIIETSPGTGVYEIAENGYVVRTYYNGNKDDYVKSPCVTGDGYTPYMIEYNDNEYPVESFYPSEYTYVGEDSEHNPEKLSLYDYNSKVWCEDYFAFEYFMPTDVDDYVAEANQDDLVKYSWETYFSLKDEEAEQYRPYRYLNITDKDTVITPEQYEALSCKTEWEISEYTCVLDSDIKITAEEYSNVTKYVVYNVVSPDQYALLSDEYKKNFAPYYPMRVYGFGKWFNAMNVNAETMGEHDIKFAKELMLLSKEIFASKGTIHGIDMIMSLFGFGDTYTLTEKYHFVDISNHMYNDEVYNELQMAASYDDTGIFEDVATINNEFLDNTIPMGTVELHGIDYIIPYYSSKKTYAGGEIYFQTKGGWGGQSRDLHNTPYDFKETLSYLKVVETISDLLNVNARTVRNGDIYYVLSLVDVVEYDENADNLSHFFYLNDDFNPHLYRSWTNINMEDENSPITKTAKYLDSIISTSIGNNPHTGYGKYDLGQLYLEYMKKPFKYYLDNYVLNSDVRDIMNSENAEFTIATRETSLLNGKIKNIADCEVYDPKIPLRQPTNKTGRFIDSDDLVSNTEENYTLGEKQYYLNDKTLIITNKINNNLYKKYFFNVIIHYLMQMIPSTTILILENFNINND